MIFLKNFDPMSATGSKSILKIKNFLNEKTN